MWALVLFYFYNYYYYLYYYYYYYLYYYYYYYTSTMYYLARCTLFCGESVRLVQCQGLDPLCSAPEEICPR